MGKSVRKKVVTMLMVMGVIMISACIFNMVGLKVIRDCNDRAGEYLASYMQAVNAGDEKLASEAASAIIANSDRVEKSIKNAGVLNLVQIAAAVLATAGVIFATSSALAGAAKKAASQLQEITGRLREEICAMEDDSSGELFEGMEKVEAEAGLLSRSCKAGIDEAAAMGKKARESRETVAAMKGHAESLRTQAAGCAAAAENIMKTAGAHLGEAVQESLRNVRTIDELAGNIMNIAGHMDLLALKVSIEAAKAGSAGKSFAPVSDELRRLAGNNRDTAGDIQKVCGDVARAAESAGESSVGILRFISGDTVKSYNDFENMAGGYTDDADAMGGIMDNFFNSAFDIKENMQKIDNDIKNIPETARENAEGAACAKKERVAALARSVAEMEDALHLNF